MKKLSFVLLLALLSACSNEQLYGAMQGSQRMECAKLPPGQYQSCLADLDTSYKDYEQDRQDLLRDGKASRSTSVEQQQ